MKKTGKEISAEIKKAASELGFDACGISPACFLNDEEKHLKSWLENSFHFTMKYMENHFNKRLNPADLVPGAKSVISVLLNYFPENQQSHKDAPVLSKYAYGKDYHFVVKEKLNLLFEKIKTDIINCEGRLFVDSAPLLEKALAKNAGLGWIGKNTNLINPKLGSFVFIGEILVDFETEYDKPVENKCGLCNKCIEACPTGALKEPYILDSSKCISCLTIEHRGDLPLELKNDFHNRVFGCDICQDVCPHNKKLTPHKVNELMPKNEVLQMNKEYWHKIDEEIFKKLFKTSALERTKFKGLKRNLDFISD